MPNNKIRVNRLSKDTDQSTDGDANTVNWEGDIQGSPNKTINQIQGLDEESARALIHNILGEYGITKENPLHRPEELSTEAIQRAEELLEAAKKVEMDAVEYFMLGQLAMSAGNHSEAESNFGLAENKFKEIGQDKFLSFRRGLRRRGARCYMWIPWYTRRWNDHKGWKWMPLYDGFSCRS